VASLVDVVRILSPLCPKSTTTGSAAGRAGKHQSGAAVAHSMAMRACKILGACLCLLAEVEFQAEVEDRPDRSRPPPCKPFDGSTFRSVGAVVHDHAVRFPSADSAGVGPHDRPRALRGRRGARERSLDTCSTKTIVNPIARGGPFWTPITPQSGPFSTPEHTRGAMQDPAHPRPTERSLPRRPIRRAEPQREGRWRVATRWWTTSHNT
jgi:hypothetical protein